MARQQAGARPKKAKAKKTASAGDGGELVVKRGRGKKGAGEEAGVPAITNFRPPSTADTDLFKKFYNKAFAQVGALQRAKDAVKSEMGILSQIYSEAKESGVPAERVKRMKETIKEARKDAAQLLLEEREKAWQHTTMKTKLSEVMPFAMLMQPPTMTEIEMQGEQCGRNGEPIDNCQWTPGTKQFQHWIAGHKKGQRESAAKVFGDNKGKGGAGDGTGLDDAPAGNVVRLN